jgi:hypothetical protein
MQTMYDARMPTMLGGQARAAEPAGERAARLSSLLTTHAALYDLSFNTVGYDDLIRIIINSISLHCLTHAPLTRGSSNPFDVKDGFAQMPKMCDARIPTMLGGQARAVQPAGKVAALGGGHWFLQCCSHAPRWEPRRRDLHSV